MLECNISLFFTKGPLADENSFEQIWKCQQQNFHYPDYITRIYVGGKRGSNKEPRSDLFSNIVVGSIFRANFLSDCKERIEHNKREKWQEEGKLLSSNACSSTGPGRQARQETESQSRVISFPWRAIQVFLLQTEDRSPNIYFLDGLSHFLRRRWFMSRIESTLERSFLQHRDTDAPRLKRSSHG